MSVGVGGRGTTRPVKTQQTFFSHFEIVRVCPQRSTRCLNVFGLPDIQSSFYGISFISKFVFSAWCPLVNPSATHLHFVFSLPIVIKARSSVD